MARELEKAAHAVLTHVCGSVIGTPDWLIRPGRVECCGQWSMVKEIYRALTGYQLPGIMPRREWRRVDGVFRGTAGQAFIFELDEKQHFNEFRATTIGLYPRELRLGFSKSLWMERCLSKRKLEGGSFARPKPPLFPGPNGRHRQRAFRDALTDLLPAEYGFAPTLRLADIEIRDWIFGADAADRMAALLSNRLGVS